jgi:hypothetical protein
MGRRSLAVRLWSPGTTIVTLAPISASGRVRHAPELADLAIAMGAAVLERIYGKTVFQSFFISTTVQPFAWASSSAVSSLPKGELRS